MCPVDLPPRYSPSSRLVGGRPLVSASSRMASRMRARMLSPVRLIPQPFQALERLSHIVSGTCKFVKDGAQRATFALGLLLQGHRRALTAKTYRPVHCSGPTGTARRECSVSEEAEAA